MNYSDETRPKSIIGSVFPPNPITHWNEYKSRESIIVLLFALITSLTNIVSVLPVIDWLVTEKLKKRQLWIREIYVLVIIIIPVFILFLGNPKRISSLILAHTCLLNVLSATLRDIFVSPMWHWNKEGGYIYIRSRIRWLLVVPIHACVIVTCFALIYFFYGNQFSPEINDAWTAIYQSALTFTTLGYGDIQPTCILARKMVIYELFYFFIFIGIKLPIAVSVIRVHRVQKTDVQ